MKSIKNYIISIIKDAINSSNLVNKDDLLINLLKENERKSNAIIGYNNLEKNKVNQFIVDGRNLSRNKTFDLIGKHLNFLRKVSVYEISRTEHNNFENGIIFISTYIIKETNKPQ